MIYREPSILSLNFPTWASELISVPRAWRVLGPNQEINPRLILYREKVLPQLRKPLLNSTSRRFLPQDQKTGRWMSIWMGIKNLLSIDQFLDFGYQASYTSSHLLLLILKRRRYYFFQLSPKRTWIQRLQAFPEDTQPVVKPRSHPADLRPDPSSY